MNSKDKAAIVQAAIRRSQLRRDVAEAIKVPRPAMTKAEAFSGFEDDDASTMTADEKEGAISSDEARQNIIDAGGF